MKIKFKTGNYYLCTKDYIINKELAFRRKHLYLCKKDGILEGCNEKLYRLDNIDFESEIFKIRFKMKDNVNNPSHYTWLKDKCGVEVIDITRHMDFNLGQVLKYVLRLGHKEDKNFNTYEKILSDLHKAKFYIEKEINRIEKLCKNIGNH